MKLRDFIISMYSSAGAISSSRVQSSLTLITVLGCTVYDTYINKRLDFALAGLLLAASTGHYAISKSGDKDVSVKTDTTEVS